MATETTELARCIKKLLKLARKEDISIAIVSSSALTNVVHHVGMEDYANILLNVGTLRTEKLRHLSREGTQLVTSHDMRPTELLEFAEDFGRNKIPLKDARKNLRALANAAHGSTISYSDFNPPGWWPASVEFTSSWPDRLKDAFEVVLCAHGALLERETRRKRAAAAADLSVNAVRSAKQLARGPTGSVGAAAAAAGAGAGGDVGAAAAGAGAVTRDAFSPPELFESGVIATPAVPAKSFVSDLESAAALASTTAVTFGSSALVNPGALAGPVAAVVTTTLPSLAAQSFLSAIAASESDPMPETSGHAASLFYDHLLADVAVVERPMRRVWVGDYDAAAVETISTTMRKQFETYDDLSVVSFSVLHSSDYVPCGIQCIRSLLTYALKGIPDAGLPEDESRFVEIVLCAKLRAMFSEVQLVALSALEFTVHTILKKYQQQKAGFVVACQHSLLIIRNNNLRCLVTAGADEHELAVIEQLRSHFTESTVVTVETSVPTPVLLHHALSVAVNDKALESTPVCSDDIAYRLVCLAVLSVQPSFPERIAKVKSESKGRRTKSRKEDFEMPPFQDELLLVSDQLAALASNALHFGEWQKIGKISIRPLDIKIISSKSLWLNDTIVDACLSLLVNAYGQETDSWLSCLAVTQIVERGGCMKRMFREVLFCAAVIWRDNEVS